ncbi:MAG: hypothetical protein ABUK01_05325 [Leptospirales bacterium]
MNKMEEVFYKTNIWKHFEKVAGTTEIELVKNLISHCVPILERIIETFPTYTLHNGQHQLNILNLYADLLGSKLKKLSSLEAAILILSALFHDIGMVFNKEERENLKEEDLSPQFLVDNPSARLLQNENGDMNDELAEWYCRWSHAKRVWVYLDQIDELLKWDGTNFRQELAQVCFSHNEKANYIETDAISSNFWNSADLKFCAIILRLADILDFDKSRSPESVYKYLGLDKPKSRLAKNSHKEWSKHLASGGFDFKGWSNTSTYTLYYKASPDHPAVENDINDFLDIIENEMQECRAALRSCSDKWKDFILPEKIDRTNIYSQGYTTGSFKFSLDQKQILNLLMGENLYENPFVFMRELIQNAMDTTRYRKKHETHITKSGYAIQPIKVSSWDDSGFKWVRIDDFGMGMTLQQIEKYFLKIGNSLYNSDEFKVSKLDYSKVDKDFTPVSRFGIGILSCFLVADVIEVSTKSVYCDKDENHPIRLTLQGIANYYFLYTGKDIPKEMPHEHKIESGYRRDTGTSIALRINPNYDRKEFDIPKLLESLVYASQVPVEYNSILYGKEQIKNLPNKKRIHKLSDAEISKIKEFIEEPYLKMNPEIHIVPIPLVHEKVKNARGIIYVFLFRANITFSEDSKFDKNNFSFRNYRKLSDFQITFKYQASTYDNEKESNFFLKVSRRIRYGQQIKDFKIPLNHLISDLDEFNGSKNYNSVRTNILLSHNGIIIPNNANYIENVTSLDIRIREKKSGVTFCLGIVNLKDDLRPNLNIARDKIISFPWNCFSQICFLIRKSLDENEYNFRSKIDYFRTMRVQTDNIDNDDFINSDDGWPEVITIGESDFNVKSVPENKKVNLDVFDRDDIDNADLLKRKVIFNNCIYTIRLVKKKREDPKKNESDFELIRKAYIVGKRKYKSTVFPSDIACEYENFSGLMPLELDYQLYNINHHFTKWLKLAYSELTNNYPYYLWSIFDSESIEELNSNLDKVKKLLPEELRPDFNITKSDFEVDFNKLEEE